MIDASQMASAKSFADSGVTGVDMEISETDENHDATLSSPVSARKASNSGKIKKITSFVTR